jgi:Fe-S oxidoreductase
LRSPRFRNISVWSMMSAKLAEPLNNPNEPLPELMYVCAANCPNCRMLASFCSAKISICRSLCSIRRAVLSISSSLSRICAIVFSIARS